MILIRAVLLKWLLDDVAPSTLLALGLADRVAALRSPDAGYPSGDERARLRVAVQETLERLGALEAKTWTAIAALSCIERMLGDDAPPDALAIAIAARVADRAGLELPRIAKAGAVERRSA